MKSLKLVLLAALSCQALHPVNSFTLLKQGGDWIFRNTLGYIEISELYHPHAKKYFNDLYEKYPDILQKSSLYITSNTGPAATFQSIYFPVYWIEKLEQELLLKQEDGLYRQATEWIILHEAGHIHHNDAAIATAGALIGGYLILASKTNPSLTQKNSLNEIKNFTNFIIDSSSMIKALAGVYGVYAVYSLWREYHADQFATKHCTNPKAVAAAYEYLERCAPSGINPGINHSFKGFRLQRIANAYKEKFGHEIPKTYHATDRVTA